MKKFSGSPLTNPFFLPLIALLYSVPSFAFSPDTTEYYSATSIRYEDRVYAKNIRTAQLSADPSVLANAIVKMNSDDRLYLSFDDLDSDYKVYYYTIIHCSAKWEPSNLLVSEYLDGFAENQVSRYNFSRTTLQKYTHYSTEFPNDGLKMTKSGNYIVEVYLDNNPAKVVLTKRFLVYEEKADVSVIVRAPTIVADRNFKQEVDFTINFNSADISNPYQEIFPVIMQNGRWDNAITGLQPMFVKDQQAVYDFEEGNVFRGGSEFRWFDTRSLRYQSERIQHIEKDSNSIYNVWLLPDEKRTYKRYLNSNDINGKYLIKTTDGGSDDVDADYAWVHFFLPWDPPTTEGNMYVFGAFCDWRAQPEYRLKYNYALHGYEASVYLKQGYYNYEYVLLRDNDKAADDMFVEGMHQETENEYTVLVYYHKQGSWVDELVAVKKVSSRQ
ncbi:MAG: DUF5103 domain-containing protein [Bacteroidota bacterium]|nr:DUF5103 domain-containing protein [Bacteroidota bacterium]